MVEGCYCPLASGIPDARWFPIVARTRMKPDAEMSFHREKGLLTEESEDQLVSHVRLTIFPDGGISRIRVYGKGEEELPPLTQMRRHKSVFNMMASYTPSNDAEP